MIYIFLLLIIFSSELIIRYNLLSDKIELSKHKAYVNKNKVPVTGGIFLIIFLFIFKNDIGYLNLFYLFIVFLIGLFSDRLKNFSPTIRLFLQILVTLLFIQNSQTLIFDVRLDIVNNFLENNIYISFFFTIFCFVVFLNGTNFIDGINLNTTGYFIIVYSIILIISKNNDLSLDFNLNYKILIFLIVIYFLNFFNKTQFGDSGAYLISFFTAFYVIKFVNSNPLVSPYFAVLLIWYPCFENLFSIIRKINQKKSISDADNLHLHHNIFLFLKKKDFNNTNNLSGLILNLSNLFLLLLSIYFFNSTKHLILITLINICIYVVAYNILIKVALSKKFKK